MAHQGLRRTYGLAAVFIVLVALWEWFSTFHPGMRFILPAPTKIVETLRENSDRLLFHSLATLEEMAAGFLLAFALAFPAAWMMACYAFARTFFQPLFIAVQCVPIFALAPIMVLWFGWSFAAVVVPTALMVFFPLVMSIYQGLRSAPREMTELFILHRATPFQLLFKLQLPWALPQIFTGLRVAISLAGIAAIAGEWAGAQSGLGILMLESRRGADIEMMFAALVCVTLLSLGLYAFVVLMERFFLKRRNSQKGGVSRLLPLVAAMCLISCGRQERSETVMILDWLPNPNHVALYAGIEEGIFARHGIDLNLRKVADPGDTIPYVLSGHADVCLTYMPHAIQAMAKGADVVSIGKLIEGPLNAVIYREGKGIVRIEDLNGIKIGYCVDGFDKAFLRSMFGNRSIVPGEYLNVSFDLVNAIGMGHVDALFGAYWNIESENLRARGIDVGYFPLSAFDVPDYDELIFIARKGGIQATDDFIRRFQTAMQESIDMSLKDPERAFRSYVGANPDKSRSMIEWERLAWQKTTPVLARSQQIDPGKWKAFADWLKNEGLLEP